jgi:tRNA(adenine34) deaminase
VNVLGVHPTGALTDSRGIGTLPDVEDFDELMRAALAEARKAFDLDEVPIGAVIATEGRIVAAGFNQPIRSSDPTAHAEIVALRAAGSTVGNYRLSGATLCVTVEPCAMCVGALVHARIGMLVFGALEPKTGAVRSTMNLVEHPSWNHRIEVVSGVLETECRAIVQRFFREKRGQR